MPIFSLNDINNLLELEDELENDFNKVSYIEKCYNKVLNKCLFKHFGRNYLFHRAYYLDKKNNFHPTRFTIPFSEKSKIISDILDKGVNEIVSGIQVTTFTELMCSKHKQVLCLYKFSQKVANYDNSGQSLSCDLMSKDVISKMASFFGMESLHIELLIDHYRDLVGKTRCKSCFVYFLRPLTNFKNYNGVFSIILKRKLSESELVELSTMWRKVLSDTVLVEVKNEIRISEQHSIFEEHNHSWNSEITSLSQHIELIEKHYRNQNKVDKTIMEHINYAATKTQILRKTIQFNMFLMKTQGYKDWDEIKIKKFKETKGELISENSIKSLNLKLELKKALRSMLVINKSYLDINSESIEKVKINQYLLKQIDEFPKMNSRAIPMGVYIIFLDLLKNAFYHMDENGFVDIKYKIENQTCFLCFENDGELSETIKKFLNYGLYDEKLLFKRIGGVRTIRRIIECSLFCDLQEGWGIIATCKNRVTKICLTIPLTH